MKFEVTQADIDKGELESCERCPIALALKRGFPFPTNYIRVGNDCVIWSPKSDESRCYELPFSKRVQRFIRDFDAGAEVAPFAFKLLVS